MASIRATVPEVELIIRPYRLVEEGDPKWFHTYVHLTANSAELLSTTVSMTDYDLNSLQQGIQELAAGMRHDFRLVSSDEDFIVEVERDTSVDEMVLNFWAGEPYALMRGYRFHILMENLVGFANGLRVDQAAAALPSRPP